MALQTEQSSGLRERLSFLESPKERLGYLRREQVTAALRTRVLERIPGNADEIDSRNSMYIVALLVSGQDVAWLRILDETFGYPQCTVLGITG